MKDAAHEETKQARRAYFPDAVSAGKRPAIRPDEAGRFLTTTAGRISLKNLAEDHLMSNIARTIRNVVAAVATTFIVSTAGAQVPSTTKPASSSSPLSVLQTILSNPTNLDFVKQYTTDDFTYVSLNYGTPEVKQALPWAGTTNDVNGLVQAFIDVGRYWKVENFQIQDSFENDDGAAIFGTFTYTSNTLGKTVTSPFAVLARGRGGKLSYVQFMEDTFATVRSFRESGQYRIKANPDGSKADI